jgi:hypothetical protein
LHVSPCERFCQCPVPQSCRRSTATVGKCGEYFEARGSPSTAERHGQAGDRRGAERGPVRQPAPRARVWFRIAIHLILSVFFERRIQHSLPEVASYPSVDYIKVIFMEPGSIPRPGLVVGVLPGRQIGGSLVRDANPPSPSSPPSLQNGTSNDNGGAWCAVAPPVRCN